MANEEIKIIINADDRASGVLNSITNKVGGLGGALTSLAKIAGVGLVAAGGALTAFAASSIKAFGEQEVAQKRLGQILKTTTDASEEQINSLLDQANALEKLGVVQADAIITGQGTFATFDLQADSIKKLTPAFLDMVVAEKGVNATTEDMISWANGLGQALQGNFASLTKRGFILDENTKSLIENGTETQRVEALVKVMNSTYEGMNATMRGTTEGGIKGMQMAFSQLKEMVGGVLAEALTPFINEITTWAQDPATQEQLAEIAEGFAEFIKQLTPLIKEILPVFISLMKFAGEVILTVSGFLFKDLPNALGTAIFWVQQMIDKLNAFIQKIEEALKKLRDLVSAPSGGTLNPFQENFSLPSWIPKFATGGIVNSPTLAMVGEAGPEAIVPLGKGGVGLGGVVINITGTFLSEDAADRLANILTDKLKMQLRI